MHLPPSSESVPTTPPRALMYAEPRLARLSESAYGELRSLVTQLLEATLGFLLNESGEEPFLAISGLFIARIVRIHDRDEGKSHDAH